MPEAHQATREHRDEEEVDGGALLLSVSPNVYPGRSCAGSVTLLRPGGGLRLRRGLAAGNLADEHEVAEDADHHDADGVDREELEYGMMWSRPEVAAIQAATSRAVIPPTTPNAFCVLSP